MESATTSSIQHEPQSLNLEQPASVTALLTDLL